MSTISALSTAKRGWLDTSRFFGSVPPNLERLYRWLSGRHRFLATYVTNALRYPPQWQDTLLNLLAWEHAGVWPSDHASSESPDQQREAAAIAGVEASAGLETVSMVLEHFKGKWPRVFYRENLRKLVLHQHLQSMVAPAIFKRWQVPGSDLIFYGFTRYNAQGPQSKITINEPLALHAF